MWKQIGLLLVAVFWCSLVWAASVPEVPHAEVTLRGGPEKGKAKEGENFVLNCSFSIKHPKNSSSPWKTVTTFYLDGEELGEYRSKLFFKDFCPMKTSR